MESSESTPAPAGLQDLQKFNLIKYPYNGRAPNLIDKFMIIGYDTKVLEKTLPLINEKYAPELAKQGIDSNPISVKSDERPTIINEVCFDYQKEVLDNEMVLELLFPDKPIFYLFKLPQSPNDKINMNIGTTGIIFSLGPQDNNNSKKSYNGFGYLFYEFEKSKNMFIGLPKIFCFLSEYPYFSAFNNLSQKLQTMFKNNGLTFSLEALIYNLVTFLPSPLHFSINLSIWKVSNSEFEIKRKDTAPAGSNSSNKQNLVYISSNSNQIKAPKNDSIITFPQLSGYPLFHFNLPFLFTVLPVEIIIEVFLFTFLENDIIFYSANLDLLNLVMYIFSNLNYPCNDSIYFWHILSVSIEAFMNSTSTFVGKTCSTMIGINNSYDPKIKTTLRIKEHFILDIDNKEFFYVSAENTREVNKNRLLHDCISKILKNTSNVQGEEVTQAIKELSSSLTPLSKKIIEYSSFKTDGTIDLFKYDEQIAKQNRNIQKIFYTFVLKIFMKYYNLSVGFTNEDTKGNVNSSQFSSSNEQIRSSNKSGFFVEYKQNESSFEFERIFDSKFKESSKFGTYVINFMLFYDTIDLFKIPLLFTEEFINRMKFSNTNKSRGNINLNSPILSDYLDIIDQLYYTKNNEDILLISQKTVRGKTQMINFNGFYEFHEKKLKPAFVRNQMISDLFDKKIVGGTKKINYKRCELDQRFLFEYIYTLNNLSDKELKEIFPMLPLIRNNNIEVVRQSIIGDIVEQNLISQKCLDKLEFIVFSIFNMIAATRELNDDFEDPIAEIKLLTRIGNATQFNLRKYMMRIINIYAQLILKASSEQKMKERSIYLECYNLLRKYVQEKGVIPNEEFMALLNSSLINDEEKNSIIKTVAKKNSNILDEYEEIGKVINTKCSFIPLFKYVKLEPYLENIKYEILEDSFFTLTDNIGFDGDITQLENLDKQPSNNNGAQSKTTKKKILIECSIENANVPPFTTTFYSPRKLFNETNRVINNYNVNMNISRSADDHFFSIIWNIIYYIHLIPKIFDKFPVELMQTFLAIYVSLKTNKPNISSKVEKPEKPEKPEDPNKLDKSDDNVRDMSIAPIASEIEKPDK